jgi:hypothetical protein
VARWECDPICLSSSYFEYLFVFQLSHAMRTWQLYGFFQIQGYERNNIERGWSITTWICAYQSFLPKRFFNLFLKTPEFASSFFNVFLHLYFVT